MKNNQQEMYKINLTGEELMNLSIILSSIGIKDIDIHSFKEKTIPIIKRLSDFKPDNSDNQVTNNAVHGGFCREHKEEFVKNEPEPSSAKPLDIMTLIPSEFFNTYNAEVELENSQWPFAIMAEGSNYRFLKGRGGQIGIEYWDDYIDIHQKPTSKMWISCHDMVHILDFLKEVSAFVCKNITNIAGGVSDFLISISKAKFACATQFKIQSDITHKCIDTDIRGYQIEINFLNSSWSIFKEKDSTKIEFYSLELLYIFCEYVDYHL